MKVSRFQAFSDGVFAILITILVLEFRLPDYQNGHLLSALLHQWPLLLSYSFSFFYVGTLWLFHHDYFSLLRRLDRGINLLNLLLLFSVSLIDYPTSLVATTLTSGNSADLRTAFIVYDLVALFISATFSVLYRYLQDHPSLQQKGIKPELFRGIRFDPLRSVSIYLLVIGATFWSLWLGAVLLAAGIIFHFIAYLHLSRQMGQLESLGD